MAINHTNVFEDLGSLVEVSNLLETASKTTLDGYYSTIDTAFNGNSTREVLTDYSAKLGTLRSNLRGGYNSMRNGLALLAAQRFQDRTTVIDELGIGTTNIDRVLAAYHRAMKNDSVSVLSSAVSLGSLTADASNVGSALPVVDNVLDGVSSPGKYASGTAMQSLADYNGLNSELIIPGEQITIECVAGQEEGLDYGAEEFRIYGLPDNGPWTTYDDGSGETTGVYGMVEDNVMSGPFFQTDPWVAETGEAGWSIGDDVAQAFYSNKYGIFDPVTATSDLSRYYPMAASLFKPGKKYAIGVAYRKAGSPASGNLEAYFTGHDYTATSAEKVLVPYTSWTTSWQFAVAWITMPNKIEDGDDSWRLNLKVTSADTATAGNKVHIGAVLVSPAYWHGGFSVVIPPGQTYTRKGDIWRFDTSGTEGVFQKFFRRWKGIQMPSLQSGSNTIDEALAT